MTETRPSGVACALKGCDPEISSKPKTTWCGRVVGNEWVFTGVDRALFNEKRGRTLLCPDCADQVKAVLRSICYRATRKKRVDPEETEQQKRERVAVEMARAYYGDP